MTTQIDENFWNLYDEYEKGEFRDELVKRMVHRLLLPEAQKMLHIQRNDPLGSNVIALRAECCWSVNRRRVLEIQTGDVLLIDKREKELLLIGRELKARWKLDEVSCLPITRKGKLLWLPILNLAVVRKIIKVGRLSPVEFTTWAMHLPLLGR